MTGTEFPRAVAAGLIPARVGVVMVHFLWSGAVHFFMEAAGVFAVAARQVDQLRCVSDCWMICNVWMHRE
jgi:hypothetical protein